MASPPHSIFLLLFLTAATFASPLSFNLSAFTSDDANRRIVLQGDAYISPEGLQVTTDESSRLSATGSGRATFVDPLHLWDNATGNLTDFHTHFSFLVQTSTITNCTADGLAFFMSPVNSSIPVNSTGGGLGLAFNNVTANVTGDPFVAVEFDTFPNFWDPTIGPHVGIDADSLVSAASAPWRSNFSEWMINEAWISYNSASKNLTVNFTSIVPTSNRVQISRVEYAIDLRKYLPEFVSVGFSAATGECYEKNNVKSWSFSSTLESKIEKTPATNNSVPVADLRPTGGKRKVGEVVGVVAGLSVCVVGLSFLGYLLWRRRRKGVRKDGEEREDIDLSMEMEFEIGAGPRRFSYAELVHATDDFSEEFKLGEGGFGGVYRGFLKDLGSYVAVKRVSKTSKQGAKEYASEVRIISRLRHRNLVQLIGWCHERRELLLVYEYMPNGSLDLHLFGEKLSLDWETRYKIARGLASALLYLHQEWEQCVVHRDIKSSNVMLDSGFNTKLGDFGLARLVDHDKESRTTILAGTMGYMAPECVMTGKASKESDVYSFGIVALEIATGRKPIDIRAQADQVRIIDWVWGLYGRGVHLEAGDPKLSEEGYDEKEVERLMVVGLWCAHPDYTLRPSIRQVVQFLEFESEPPPLPSKMPVPTYSVPPVNSLTSLFSEASAYDSNGSTTTTSNATSSTSSSASAYLLHSR